MTWYQVSQWLRDCKNDQQKEDNQLHTSNAHKWKTSLREKEIVVTLNLS